MAGKKGMKEYPLVLKLEVCRLHYEEGKTTKELKESFNINDERRLKVWFKKYRNGDYTHSNRKKKGRPKKYGTNSNSTENYVKRLEMENELLRNFLLEMGRWSIKN